MLELLQTKVEDAFQRLRMQETQGQANRVVSYDRMWATLVHKKLLSSLHKYDEVNMEETGWKRTLEDLPRRPPRALYLPHKRKPVLPLHHVMSDKQEAAWPTYSGASQPRQFIDAVCFVESLADCKAFWKSAEKLHRCTFFPTNVLVRKKKSSDQWMLSCGNVDKGALLLLPMHKIKARTYQPCCRLDAANPEASFKLQLVAHVDEWEGQAVTWHDPAHFMDAGAAGSGAASSSKAAPGAELEGTEGAACVLDAPNKVLSIQALSASLGFGGMPAAAVRKMLEEAKDPVAPDADEFDTILHGKQYKKIKT